jgi:carbonic anhydrase/acetyltransferase-like protein (isoleucine patch superfamily)
MIIPSPHTGIKPRISPKAFVAPTATIIGDVVIEEGANIWFGAVLRGDVCAIRVGKNTSVQDNCILHSEIGTTCMVKDHIIMGHSSIVHGPCTIGSKAMIGIASTVLQRSTVGTGTMIGAGAVAKGEISEKSLMLGIPAILKRPVSDEEIEGTYNNALFYANNGQKFREAGHNHPSIEAFWDVSL